MLVSNLLHLRCHATSLGREEDTDATNELINDGEYVQLLTLEEIEALKLSGAHGSVRYLPRVISSACHVSRPAGHNQKTNRTARYLFTENRVQQGEIQEEESSQVVELLPCISTPLLTKHCADIRRPSQPSSHRYSMYANTGSRRTRAGSGTFELTHCRKC
jgi:hypothetical protein